MRPRTRLAPLVQQQTITVIIQSASEQRQEGKTPMVQSGTGRLSEERLMGDDDAQTGNARKGCFMCLEGPENCGVNSNK